MYMYIRHTNVHVYKLIHKIRQDRGDNSHGVMMVERVKTYKGSSYNSLIKPGIKGIIFPSTHVIPIVPSSSLLQVTITTHHNMLT